MIRLLRKFITYYFHSSFKKCVKTINRNVLICDIDNSIANTWPQWNNKDIEPKSFYSKVPPLIKSINFVKDYCSKNNLQIIFISARPNNQILNTKNWLNKYFGNQNQCFIVKNAKDKLWYYEALLELNKQFEVFDDLSFNHENGEVKYYNDLILFLNANHIKHFDYSFITKLNEETA